MKCPKCNDTGIAHVAPYIVGTEASHTMTACTCEAAMRMLAILRARAAQSEGEA